MKFITTIFTLFAFLTLLACSANYPHSLHQAQLSIGKTRPSHMLVIVRDARQVPESIGVELKPYYAGLVRQAFGDPIPLMVSDGFTVASGIAQALCSSFTKHGWNCESVVSDSQTDIKQELPGIAKRYTATKVLYLYINEWQTNVSARSEVTYDFNLTLWNKSLQLLAAVGEQGTQTLPIQSYLNPADNAARGAPLILASILSGLLNEPKLIAKL